MKDTKRVIIIARTLAASAIVLGVFFIYIIVSAYLRRFPSFESVFEVIFLFIFPMPVLAFGCYCIYCGYHFWFKMSPQNLRRILFVITIIIFLFLLPVFGGQEKNSIIFMFSIPLLMIPAGIFYISSIRLFLRLLALPTEINWTQREKSARRYFGWFGFFLIISSFNLLRIFLPPENTDATDFKALLVLPIIIAIIVLALMVYKFGVKIAIHNKPKEVEISAYPSSNNPLSSPEH